jgi:UDP-GlcNAc:undecaprenyl-phosphate GlcNAc-1-phosphate transferase
MIFLAITAASFVICVGLTWLVRRVALLNGLVCRPSMERQVHSVAVPRLGGIAIFVTVAAVPITEELLVHGAGGFRDFNVLRLLAILGAGAIVFSIGLLDDLRPVRPYSKIAAQVLAGSVFFFFTGHRIWHFQSFGGHSELASVLSFIAVVSWIMLVSNAFNLIDGLDGLAASSALCSAVALFLASIFTHHEFIPVITSSLCGAIVGFLLFNFNPASIFLGDCGSLFLGVVLAELGLSVQTARAVSPGILLAVACFTLPLVDTALAITRRSLNGQPLFSADREHIHHKLLQRGLSQRQIVFLLCGVSVLCSLLAFVFIRSDGKARIALACVAGLGLFAALRALGYRELDELQRIARRVLTQKQIVRNDLILRRATERLRCEPSLDGVCHALVYAFERSDFDRFRLQLEDIPPGAAGLLSPTASGQFVFDWSRSKGPDVSNGNWRIHLELSSSIGRSGELTIVRLSAHKPLLIDLDLVTNELRLALSYAVERARSHFGISHRTPDCSPSSPN